MSSACPSAAWDRHISELDDAAEAEAIFFRSHRDDILKVACALLAGGFQLREKMPNGGTRLIPGELIQQAAEVVRLLNESGELP